MKDDPIQSLAKPIQKVIDELKEKQQIARVNASLEEAQQSIIELTKAVQEYQQAKTKFVSVVTHELRIPMTSIKGYTDLLRQGAVGPVNEQQANFLGVIRNNIDRMSQLVSDLSDISHIESGRIKLDSACIPIMPLIDEVMANFKPRFAEKNQILEVDAPDNLPSVYGDTSRISQVLNNILNNACRYTPSGGKITLRAQAERTKVRITIRDTGIGISPADQKQLFTQFFRSEDPAVRDQQGWGLGLTVAKKFLEIMGGEIGVQSALKEGSSFWFTLPAREEET